MRFKGLDLNLLVTLDVLLDEHNVSRAAERLHLSQPAVSAALARLRQYFGDPLLAVHGKRMIPTAQAIALQPLLKDLLAQVDTMISQSTGFDPATSTRWFRIGVSDYLSTVLFSTLVPRIKRLAPGIRFDLQPPSDEMLPLLDRGEIDLVLTPEAHCSPAHPSEVLFEERHVIAGWKDNPLFSRPMTEDDFYAAAHVAVELGRVSRVSFAESGLAARGKSRSVEVLTSSFSLVPELLIGTDRIAIMHERLAKALARRVPLVWQPLPFDFPLMREMAQYHRTREADAGLRWLIDEVHQAVKLMN